MPGSASSLELPKLRFRWFGVHSVLLLIALVLHGPSDARPPIVEVIDTNPGLGSPLRLQSIDWAYSNGRVFFRGELDDGEELFVTDGTSAGTTQLADVRPGLIGSNLDAFTRVGASEGTNARVFFAADDGESGRELWVTNGEEEFTVLAADFWPGPNSSNPASLTGFDGMLYASAYDGTRRNLYQVDRFTLTSTPLGAGDFTLDSDAEFVTTDTALFFPATSTASGDLEIWSTDGTAVTQETTAGCSSIDNLRVAGGRVFFVCGSRDVLELDAGQPNGTAVIQAHFARPDELTQAGGLLYWQLDGQQVWAYDPTVPQVGIVATYAAGASIGQLTRLGSRLIFRADSGSGPEPHVADRFSASPLRDIFPGPDGSMDSSARFVVFDGLAYFRADDGIAGSELWRTDGTAMGTIRFADLVPGSDSSGPGDFLPTPIGLFFSFGAGLWATNGVAVGRIDDLQTSSIDPRETLHDPIGNRLFYGAASEGLGIEPWISDGTPVGTFRLGDLDPGGGSSFPVPFTAFPDPAGAQPSTLVFAAADDSGDEQLWQSDGTPAGTGILAVIHPTDSARLRPGILFDGRYYFIGDDGVAGTELWRTDGTAGGTERFADIDPTGDGLSVVPSWAEFDGALFFVAQDDAGGDELWTTDGVAAPRRFLDIAPGSLSSDPEALTATPSRLYFLADDDDDLWLWRSDGTEAGTERVLPSVIEDLFALGDAVLFAYDDFVTGEELWRADATSVEQVIDLMPGPDGARIRILGVIGDRLIFKGRDDAADGDELWSTDGTPGDITPLGVFDDIETSEPAVAFQDHLYFVATGAGQGEELWRTDGFTVEMVDLERGPTPSFPEKLVAGSERLFFFAYDRDAKFELHTLRPDPAFFADGFESDPGVTAE